MNLIPPPNIKGTDGFAGRDASAAARDDDRSPPPKTLIVLMLVAVAALLFSYLGAYAVTNALVAAEVVPRWPPDRDPRPGYLLWGFCALSSVFLFVAGIARCASRRQLRRIDAMAD